MNDECDALALASIGEVPTLLALVDPEAAVRQAFPYGDPLAPPQTDRMQSIFFSAKIAWHRSRLVSYIDEFRRLRAENRTETLSGVVPITMEIDLSNICNHRCPMCAGRRSSECLGEQSFPVAGDGEMIPANRAADYIVQMAAAGVRAVIFTGGGEPSTHNDLVWLASLARCVGLRVGLITHGGLLHKHDSVALLRACDWIRISVDAGSVADFLAIHGCGEREWAQVWGNIGALVSHRKHLNQAESNCTTLGIGFLAGPQNTSLLNSSDLGFVCERRAESFDGPQRGRTRG